MKGPALDQNRRRIDIIADETFAQDLENVALDDLRDRRRLCDTVDTELSYYRRLLHGRMDLLSFEMRRRSGEETRSLIEALPEILADSGGGNDPGDLPAKPLAIEAPDMPQTGRRDIDRVLEDDFLAHLPTIEDEEVESIQTMLSETESEISAKRRMVYDAYERIQSELSRRYRQGLADVDELLGS
ncbi:MAG: hypothetical protein HKN91_16650 [Acidimicrobiia bacterium]|nr:hypothetical protein [Acidimicrobiia bacterium]